MSIIWIDTETTGLDPCGTPRALGPFEHKNPKDPDRLLEVAVVITRDDLSEIGRREWVTDEARQVDYAKIDPVVRAMHAASGLWCSSLASPFSVGQVDQALAQFIVESGAKGSPIAGNTIRFDREFARRWLPMSLELLHYRDLNVSTLSELAQRFWPEVYKNRPQAAAHRAMSDVLCSIEQMRYYLQKVGPAGFVAALAPNGALSVGKVADLQAQVYEVRS